MSDTLIQYNVIEQQEAGGIMAIPCLFADTAVAYLQYSNKKWRPFIRNKPWPEWHEYCHQLRHPKTNGPIPPWCRKYFLTENNFEDRD